jgi:hypothetical protein
MIPALTSTAPASWKANPWNSPKANIDRLKSFMEAGSEKPSGKYVSYAKSQFTKPDYDVLTMDDEGKDGVYSWGTNSLAGTDDLDEKFRGCDGFECDNKLDDKVKHLVAPGITKFGEDESIEIGDAARVIASFTGGISNTGMRTIGASSGGKDTILLSFSGGGHMVEYEYTSNEEIVSDNYALSMELTGTAESSWSVETFIVGKGLPKKSETDTFTKTFSSDHVFGWNKRAQLKTRYALGDEHYGDKFVIQVASDSRFGTPMYLTKGGRSSCPGEPQTMWREAGFELSIDMKSSTQNLNPNERALMRVIIKNGSPFKEATELALKIVDGMFQSMNQLIEAAYDAIHAGGGALAVSKAVEKAAANTMAKNSDEVKKVVAAAAAAVENGATPSEVAARVATVANQSPMVGSELNDVQFRINGVPISPLGDLYPFKFAAGDSLDVQKRVMQTTFTLAVEPGYDTTAINYLGLSLESLCEAELASHASHGMYRAPISHTIPLSEMSWAKRCPAVQFDPSTVAKYLFSSVSPKSASTLELKVNNPDQSMLWPSSSASPTANENLKFVRVQYRPVSGGEWITAKDESSSESDKKKNLLCADSRSEGCAFDWNVHNQYERLLSGFKDGTYEIRVKNFCAGGPSLAESSVHEYIAEQKLTLTVDTFAPIAQTLVRADHWFTWSFSEPLDCSKQTIEITRQVKMACDDNGQAKPQAGYKPTELSADEMDRYAVKCYSLASGMGYWSINFPRPKLASAALSKKEQCELQCAGFGTFSVLVSGVSDVSGNVADVFAVQMVGQNHCGVNAAPPPSSQAALGENVEKDSSILNSAPVVAEESLGASVPTVASMNGSLLTGVFAVAGAVALAFIALQSARRGRFPIAVDDEDEDSTRVQSIQVAARRPASSSYGATV